MIGNLGSMERVPAQRDGRAVVEGTQTRLESQTYSRGFSEFLNFSL